MVIRQREDGIKNLYHCCRVQCGRPFVVRKVRQGTTGQSRACAAASRIVVIAKVLPLRRRQLRRTLVKPPVCPGQRGTSSDGHHCTGSNLHVGCGTVPSEIELCPQILPVLPINRSSARQALYWWSWLGCMLSALVLFAVLSLLVCMGQAALRGLLRSVFKLFCRQLSSSANSPGAISPRRSIRVPERIAVACILSRRA
jgi:hypothetical protein